MPTRSSGFAHARQRDSLHDVVDHLLGRGRPVGLGVDGTRRDGVDPDVLAAEFGGQLLGQAVDADLGQPVEVRVQPRRGRRLVDDRAAAALGHLAVHRAGAHQRAVEVHAHELLVVVPVDGDEEVELHAAEDRRVVDQVVDATELGECLGRHLLGGVGIRHVDPHGERVAAFTLDAVGDLLRAFGVDVGDDDGGTLTGERLGVRLADAAARAGDDRHLLLELISIKSHAQALRSF